MIFVVSCSTLVRVPEIPRESSSISPEDAWAEVLRAQVDVEGRVDFSGLHKNPQRLHRYIHYIAKVGPKTHPQDFNTLEKKLSHYLNSYNALSMYNVLESDLPDTLAGGNKVRFFYFTKFVIAGEEMSLYTYENTIIRALGEERVHFALNCMSRGCPRLPQKPFVPSTLMKDLDAEAFRFFNEERNVRVDPQKKAVYISEILKFFTEDFLKKSPSLIHYVNRYRKEKVPEGYQVRFIPYDWKVNHQRPVDRKVSQIRLGE